MVDLRRALLPSMFALLAAVGCATRMYDGSLPAERVYRVQGRGLLFDTARGLASTIDCEAGPITIPVYVEVGTNVVDGPVVLTIDGEGGHRYRLDYHLEDVRFTPTILDPTRRVGQPVFSLHDAGTDDDASDRVQVHPLEAD